MRTETKDVTDNPDYWGGYQPDSVYEIVQPVFICGLKAKKYLLSPEGFYDRFDNKDDPNKIDFPGTIKEFLLNPQKYPDYAVIPQRTQLKLEKIIYRNNGIYSEIFVYGKMLSGEFQSAEVYINHISISANTSSPAATIFQAPDSKYIRVIGPATHENSN